jgi:tetratricopeptide (TPR) repeat protein
MIDFFLILIILFSLFVLIKIFVRKFPILSKIDLEKVSKEKNVKFEVLERRIREKIKESKIKKWLNKNLNEIAFKIKNKISNLEEKYRKKYLKIIKDLPKELEENVRKIISEGEELMKKNDLEGAKEKFKEAILLDSRNVDAFYKLAEIYLIQRKFFRAIKILKHTLKINKQTILWWKIFRKNEKIKAEIINQLAFNLFNLGTIYQQIGKNKEAIKYFKKALKYKPNDPKIIDFLIENLIILKEKKEAEKYLAKLKEINPENQKIPEFEEKIKTISLI